MGIFVLLMSPQEPSFLKMWEPSGLCGKTVSNFPGLLYVICLLDTKGAGRKQKRVGSRGEEKGEEEIFADVKGDHTLQDNITPTSTTHSL